MKITNRVYLFKITLKGITPLIWRRILVPTNYNFWDFHVAIQDSMGWLDCHLHQFIIKKPHARKSTEIGIPYEDDPVLAGWNIKISDYFMDLGIAAQYLYDFGDSWEHEVILEGLLVKEKGTKYPKCIEGKRACPPEDCGGIDGYYRFLQIINDPSDDQYDEMLQWIGGEYDAENYSPNSIIFDNPKRRWKNAFKNENMG